MIDMEKLASRWKSLEPMRKRIIDDINVQRRILGVEEMPYHTESSYCPYCGKEA